MISSLARTPVLNVQPMFHKVSITEAPVSSGHFKRNITLPSLVTGVVSVNQSKSDEQTRSNSQPSRQPSIDFFNVKCFYLHLYQLIRTLINFRLKTKLPLFHNQLTPVSSDCAINGRKQSLHEYESLNVTAKLAIEQ